MTKVQMTQEEVAEMKRIQKKFYIKNMATSIDAALKYLDDRRYRYLVKKEKKDELRQATVKWGAVAREEYTCVPRGRYNETMSTKLDPYKFPLPQRYWKEYNEYHFENRQKANFALQRSYQCASVVSYRLLSDHRASKEEGFSDHCPEVV